MEGKRVSANITYDYAAYPPHQNPQKYRINNSKQDEGAQFYRKEYESFNHNTPYAEAHSRGSLERQPSPSTPRRPVNYSNYNQAEKPKFEPNQGNQVQFTKRNPNMPDSERGLNERPSLNQPSDQMYGYQQNDEEVQNDGGYTSYDENEDEYYAIGDYVRTDGGDYECNNPAYEELNQMLEEGDYVSIIDDQSSTDDAESYNNYGYRGDYDPQTMNATYGEPFNAVCYGGQRNYSYDPQEQHDQGFYSASNIPTAKQRQTYRARFQNSQQSSPTRNPESSSCPVLPNNANQQKRKDIFKQVSKKINETVAELRNAGIEEKAGLMRESNPNLDYIRRYNRNIRSIETMKEPPFRIPRRIANQEKPQPHENRNEDKQKKLQQQQQLDFYRQMMQKKRLLDLENGPPNSQGVPQIQGRTSSPQRPTQHSSKKEGLNKQQNSKPENFNSYQQHESPSRDGRKSIPHQLSDHSRKKMDAQIQDSFVQLHAVSDHAVQDCCRQAYKDFKKNSPL